MKRVLKTSLAWINITYIICYFGVMIFPALRNQFLQVALHFQINEVGQSVFTVGNFIWGLAWWNVITFLGIGLFAVLYNKFRD